MRVTLVAGARPNAVKVAPVHRELKRRGIEHRIVHTGQHHGAMDVWSELELPPPDVRLDAMGTHAGMTADVMVGIEKELLGHRPDWLVVVGDVNSTLGAALAAAKLGVKIAHVEAGYRSNDWSMPEEVNRVLVDRMSDLLLCPDLYSGVNARNEGGKPGAELRVVGNVMMDSLRWALAKIGGNMPPSVLKHVSGPYAVLTCHRPANVDHDAGWRKVIAAIEACPLPIVWPGHHRSEARRFSVQLDKTIVKLDPLGYLDMVALLRDASLVITDSGGLLEEALYLGKEIVSLRDPKKNERQHLLDHGVPEIWRSDAAPRIVDALLASA